MALGGSQAAGGKLCRGADIPLDTCRRGERHPAGRFTVDATPSTCGAPARWRSGTAHADLVLVAPGQLVGDHGTVGGGSRWRAWTTASWLRGDGQAWDRRRWVESSAAPFVAETWCMWHLLELTTLAGSNQDSSLSVFVNGVATTTVQFSSNGTLPRAPATSTSATTASA